MLKVACQEDEAENKKKKKDIEWQAEAKKMQFIIKASIKH